MDNVGGWSGIKWYKKLFFSIRVVFDGSVKPKVFAKVTLAKLKKKET